MSTFLISISIFVILIALVLAFFVIRHIAKRSYYFNRREIGLIRYSVTQSRGKIPEKEYLSILNEIKKRTDKHHNQ